MSFEKALNILGAVAATVGTVAPLVETLNPKVGAVLAIVGLALTTFTGRLIGAKEN